MHIGSLRWTFSFYTFFPNCLDDHPIRLLQETFVKLGKVWSFSQAFLVALGYMSTATLSLPASCYGVLTSVGNKLSWGWGDGSVGKDLAVQT